MTADFKRLGKRGSYRLGQLRAQGVGGQQRETMFRPRFARSDHRWPVSHWLLGLLAGTLLVAAGAAAGWWFIPFAAGLLAGGANWIGAWPQRVAVPAVAAMAGAGWAVPLWWAVLHGQPDGAVARETAALAGLPGYAAAGMLLTVLIAAVQAIAGYWLGRALTPRPCDG
jgi:hypothetical protein